MNSGIQLKVLMLAICLFVVVPSLLRFRRGFLSQSWRQVSALVMTSSIDRSNNIYVPKIIYRYTINSHQYTDDNYSFAASYGSSKSACLAISEKYPEGSTIKVYVNPENPTMSVIVPGVHWSQYLWLACVVIVFAGIAYIVEILNYFYPGCQPNCA